MDRTDSHAPRYPIVTQDEDYVDVAGLISVLDADRVLTPASGDAEHERGKPGSVRRT